MALDQKQKGIGPLPPLRPMQPIKSLQSGAPKSAGGLRPLQPMAPLAPMQMAQQQPVDPDDDAMDRFRAIPINPVDIPSAPFEKPMFDTPKTFEGWLKNLYDDVGSFIEGLPAMVKVAYQSGSYISKNLDGIKLLYEKPEFLTKELDRLKTDVIKSVTDTYKDGLGEALYKHPFTVLMDATTVFDILGGGLKMAGKTALTTAERQAIKAGGEISGSLATKLIKLGDNVQRTPGRIFAAPLKGAGRMALKVPALKSAAERLALTPYGIQQKNKLASFMIDERVKAGQGSEALWKQKIAKKDWDEYWDLAIGKKPLSEASKPELADHAELWREFNLHNEEWMKNMGIKTQDELEAAALKPLAERLHQEGLIPELGRYERGQFVYNKEALDVARQWVEQKGTKPSYMPYFLDRDSGLLDMLEGSKFQGQTLNKVKRFEKKGLASNIVKNPQEIQARATLQTAELRGTLRYITDTIQTSGKIVAGDKLPAGHVFMDPVLMKYVQDGLIPVHEAMVSKYADELAKGMSPADAIKGAVKHVDDTMGDAIIAKAKEAADDAKNWNIAIPVEDAYLIESQLRGVSGPLRFYDKLMNTWRSVVLRLMPRYYMNNLLGNSVMLLTGGHTPFSATVMDPKVLPGEALSAGGLLNETGFSQDFLSRVPGMKGLQKVTDRLADITDQMPRGLLANTTMKDVIKRQQELGDTAALALMAQGSMDDAVRAAFSARKEMMDLTEKQGIMTKRVNLQVQERAALDKINAEMKELGAQIDRERALSNASPVAPPQPSRPKVDPNRGIKAKRLNREIREVEAGIEDMEREVRYELQAAHESQRPYSHWTTPESAEALKAGGSFDVSKLPVHGTGSLGRGPKTNKLAGNRIYLSLDDEAWNKTLREKPGGRIEPATMENAKQGVTFYDYDQQKWMVEIGGHEEVALKPVTFYIDPKASIYKIDSIEALKALQNQIGMHWETPGFWDQVARRYDVVEVRGARTIDHDFFASAKGDQAIVMDPSKARVGEPYKALDEAKARTAGVEEAIRAAKLQLDELVAERNALTTQALQVDPATPPKASIAQLEAQIQEKIAANAPVAEIRQLQDEIAKSQRTVQLTDSNAPTRLQDLQAQLKKKFDERERLVGQYPFERSAGGLQQDIEQLVQASARRQALAPVAQLAEKGVSEMERFLGNYGRLHPIEREWVRRVIPFWTFAKTMNQLLFQMPFIAPKRAFLWNHYAKFMIDAANDDRLPYRFRNMIPIGGTRDGQMVFMRAGGFNPFEAVSMTEMGGVQIPKMVDPANNPFVKVLIETRGGYDTFTEKPFTEPTDYVSLDGTVWNFNPVTNELKTLIPQKPLVAALLNQIPHVRVIQEALDSFSGTRDIAGATRKDPEGRYYYDRSPMWAASRSLGFPIHVSDPSRVKAQHELLVKGMIKRFGSAARRVDPEQRDKLLHIINDLANGGYELREWD